jgi:aryl-alcohol dehydrogenase-like predicted oxidoreductase
VEAVVKLCLGTAQLGLAYGINNSTGVLSDDAARRLLESAVEGGFAMVDTSSEYGLAEKRVDEFLSDNPDAFDVLRRRSGSYVSVYTVEEAEAAECEMIQVPANILDGRMDAEIPRLQAKGKTVCVRSLLLQGLLAMDPAMGPGGNAGDGKFLPDAARYVSMLCTVAGSFGMTVVEMCVRWAWEIGPDVAIVGCDSAEQAKQVGEYWRRWRLPGELVSRVKMLRSDIPEHVISPRSWKQVYAFT